MRVWVLGGCRLVHIQVRVCASLCMLVHVCPRLCMFVHVYVCKLDEGLDVCQQVRYKQKMWLYIHALTCPWKSSNTHAPVWTTLKAIMLLQFYVNSSINTVKRQEKWEQHCILKMLVVCMQGCLCPNCLSFNFTCWNLTGSWLTMCFTQSIQPV